MESFETSAKCPLGPLAAPAKGKMHAVQYSQLPGPQGLCAGEDGGIQIATEVSQRFPLGWISSTSTAFKTTASKVITELKPWSHLGDKRRGRVALAGRPATLPGPERNCRDWTGVCFPWGPLHSPASLLLSFLFCFCGSGEMVLWK